MEIDKHLRADLLKPLESIELIEVEYSKKEKYEGKIFVLEQVPLKLVLSQRNPDNSEEKYHEIDFEKAKQIVIRFSDDKISVHEDSKFKD